MEFVEKGYAERAKLVNLTSSQRSFQNDVYGVKLFQANCLDFMDNFPDNKFDVIFADPPHLLSNGGITYFGGKVFKINKSNVPEMSYEFNKAWLSKCQRLLKPNGTIWVSGTYHIIHSVAYAIQQLGMKILNDITWEKLSSPSDVSYRYFTYSTETIIWAAKNEKSKHCFNYKIMKRLNFNKQMKSIWRLGAPKREEKQFGKHPTQKPVALLERIILASTNEGDLILDPFSGSSTTGVAAINLKRKFTGIELETKFIDLSIIRLKHAIRLQQILSFIKEERNDLHI